MPKFAVLSGFIVENVIVAEQKTDAEQATNKTCVEVSDSDYLDIGWLYQDGVFVDPNPPIIEEPTGQESIVTVTDESTIE